MNRNKINFIIDAVMFALMALLAGIGILIKYVLLSGEGRWEKYGRNIDLSFLGLDRHQWGIIHLIAAILLIGLLIFHIILHWAFIKNIYCKMIPSKGKRKMTVILFVSISTIFLIFPLFISLEPSKFPDIKNNHNQNISQSSLSEESSGNIIPKDSSSKKTKTTNKEENHLHNLDIEIKGYMTLQEVSNNYNVSCELIKRELKIPNSTSNNSKLGHLRKKYSFTMSDIEEIITDTK